MNARAQAVPIRPRPADSAPHPEPDMENAALPAEHALSFVPAEVMNVDEHDAQPDGDPLDANLKKLYHYLMDFPVMQLRRIAKVWDRRQHGLKKAIVARIYLYVLDRVHEDGRLLEEVLATNAKLSTFESWVSNMRLRVTWDKPPSRPELLKIIGGNENHAEDLENEHESEPAKRHVDKTAVADAELSLSEFARLILLIRSSDPIKRAIFEARREVLREEESVDRLKFWNVLVEPRYNDKAFMPTLDVDGPFEGVDARRLPGRYRKGPVLMDAFGYARQSFLVYLERWRRLGRGDPEMFAEVLPRNGRGGGISRTGKRSLMLFKLMKCWTENQDVQLLGLTSKFTVGASIRGVRGGIPGSALKRAVEEEPDTDIGSEVRSTARSKRRRRGNGKEDDSPEMGEFARGMAHAMRVMAAGKPMEKRSTFEVEREKEQYKREMRMKTLQEQTHLMRSMEEARRMIRDHDSDHEFKQMAELYYNQMKEEYMRMTK